MAYIFFEQLGRIVHEHRLTNGQTMREASKACGISLTYFCQIEHGERIPTKQETLTALFKWMGQRYRGLCFEVTK